MKTKYFIISLLMMSAQVTTVSAQVFYDSKANLAGVSGSYDELTAHGNQHDKINRISKGDSGEFGYQNKFFQNPIGITDPHLTTGSGKKIQYDMDAMTRRLNEMKAGKLVLNYLFMRTEDGKLSEDRLKQRAIKNIQLNDVERARVGVIDPNTILQEDYMGILVNNYIVFTRRAGNRTHWAVFHVDIDKKILDDVFAAWDNPSRYDAIQVHVSPVAHGNTKDDSQGALASLVRMYTFSLKAFQTRVNAVQRAVGKAVPALAIRGQVYQRNPLSSDIGADQGVRNADLLYVYRQYQDNNGQFRSRKIAEARAAAVGDSTMVIHTVYGLQPSYKKGDVVRLHTDRGVRNCFTYGLTDKLQSFTYTFDFLSSVSRIGLGRRALVSFGYSNFKDGKKMLFRFKDGKLVESPTYFTIGLGQGVEFTLLNNIQIMPYLMVNYEVVKFSTHKVTVTDTNTDYQHYYFPFTVGAKATVKIAGPLELTAGVAYTMKMIDPKNDGANAFSLNDVEEYIYEPAGLKRFGLQMNAGLCISF